MPDLPASAAFVQEEHITEPRTAWHDGESGYIRRVYRYLRTAFFIGNTIYFLNSRLKVEYRSDRLGHYFQLHFASTDSVAIYIIEGNVEQATWKLACLLYVFANNFLENCYMEIGTVGRATKKGCRWVDKPKKVRSAAKKSG